MSTDKFEWTDELVMEYAHNIHYHAKECAHILNQPNAIEQFKQEQLKSKRDWEILSFTSFDGKQYNNPNGINSWIDNGDVITSVRRLSDGEVFSVGDSVTWGAIPNLYIGEIKCFYIQDCNLCFDTEDIEEVLFQDGAYKLQHAKKQPLFTTEDGVEIFEEGVECFLVKIEKDYLIVAYDFNKKYLELPTWHLFSTKQAAVDWVAENKPLLSAKDIAALWCINESEKDTLKQLAKHKLNMKT